MIAGKHFMEAIMHQVLVDRTNPDGSRIGFVAGESFVPAIMLDLAQRIRGNGVKNGRSEIVTLLDKEGKEVSF